MNYLWCLYVLRNSKPPYDFTEYLYGSKNVYIGIEKVRYIFSTYEHVFFVPVKLDWVY